MKTVKSTTKNLTEIDLEKIRRFTQSELQKITTASELPFCYQVGSDTVIVGNYKVERIEQSTYRVSDKYDTLFDFFSRKDAIFYCIALHKKDYTLANAIHENDKQLSRLEFEALVYRKRYKDALSKGDGEHADIYSSRYMQVMARIETVKKELTKSINLAKYIKV